MSLAKVIIYEDCQSIKRYIHEHPQSVNQTDEYGFTPLIQCAILNDLEKAKLVLSFDADVNMHALNGTTALHWSAENNNLPLTQLLLAMKANANAYSRSGQPILCKPLLRNQSALKHLLVEHGASLEFTQDFIQSKLIGHRFELMGHTTLITPDGQLFPLNFEGFFLEFSLSVMSNTLSEFCNNFAAKQQQHLFPILEKVIKSFGVACELIKYQQYQVDLAKHAHWIDNLLQGERLIIPVVYEGHAITLIRYRDLLVKCDRSQNPDFQDNVAIYRMHQHQRLDKKLIRKLIYEKKSKHFIDQELPSLLALNRLSALPLPQQITGNCSWANLEACVPALISLILQYEHQEDPQDATTQAMTFLKDWQEWDKDRCINHCMDQFKQGSFAMRNSKAALLGAVLFHSNENDPRSLSRAKKIFTLLNNKKYRYIMDDYIKIYCKENVSKAGNRFKALLKAIDQPWI
jgi:hypothetical protein